MRDTYPDETTFEEAVVDEYVWRLTNGETGIAGQLFDCIYEALPHPSKSEAVTIDWHKFRRFSTRVLSAAMLYGEVMREVGRYEARRDALDADAIRDRGLRISPEASKRLEVAE